MTTQLFIDHVSMQFGQVWALRDVSARIQPGRITAFVGPNGAGKTTLFHVISGDYRPTSGRVILNGNNITGRQPWQISRMGVGRQFQDVRVFNGLSVLENVAVALMSHQEQSPLRCWAYMRRKTPCLKVHNEKAMFWLEFVGLQDYHNHMAGALSFGQQKLLSLARLLAGGMSLLLLDEPTAGLSHNMIDKLMAMIQSLVEKKGITVVFIEHNMTVVASLSYWIYFFNEGRVAFTGHTDHVLCNQKVKQTYMGLA